MFRRACILNIGQPGAWATARVAPTVENGPGALAEKTQAQTWNRTKNKFCKPRAQWPGRNRRKPLRFCAPEMFCPPQGVTPVNGVRGKATMSTKCSSGAVPGGVLVPLPPWAKELAARRRRNPPAKRAIQRPDEGIGPYKKAFYHRPLIRHGFAVPPSPQGEGF